MSFGKRGVRSASSPSVPHSSRAGRRDEMGIRSAATLLWHHYKWHISLGILVILSLPFLSNLLLTESDEEKAIKLAENLVLQHVRDPTSVLFKDVRIKGGAVRGYFNAKNGFGAYAGFQCFKVTPYTGGLMLDSTFCGSDPFF
jgi:hypothetical protein